MLAEGVKLDPNGKPCKVCGRGFISKNKRRAYCSTECSYNRKCSECGVSLIAHPRDGKFSE